MFSPSFREGKDVKKRPFLASFAALASLVVVLLISAPTVSSDRASECAREHRSGRARANVLESNNLVERSHCAREDDGDDNITATCEELLLAFGKQSDSFNTQRLEALTEAWPDPEEIGEVWAEYFEALAELFEDFGDDLADAECPFPSL